MTLGDRRPASHSPLTVEHEEYAIPLQIAHRESSDGDVLAGGLAYGSRLENRKKRFCDRYAAEQNIDCREHHLHAYLLLTAIPGIDAEIGDVYGRLRPPVSASRPGQSSVPMELLLICGIYSDPQSLVAARAFKMLEIIVYGRLAAPDLELDSIYFEPEVQRILDDYAQDFRFSWNPTAQMLAAFPLFWNHRYPDLYDEQLRKRFTYAPIELRWRTPDGSAGRATSQYPRGPGLTPLELYGQFLLYEPPIFGSLNRQILRILEMVVDDAVSLANPAPPLDLDSISPEEYIEYQKKPTERALILLEFLRTRFLYSGLAGKSIETDMKILKRVIPLVPTDDYYRSRRAKGHRAVVHGAILAVAKLLTDPDRDPFSLADEPSPLMDFIGEYFDDQFLSRIVEYTEIDARVSAGAVLLHPHEDREGE
jgi:hypothetical protein